MQSAATPVAAPAVAVAAPVALAPLERPVTLADRVYDALRAHLRGGRFDPARPLTEAALAAELGVSRTPVREALARLAAEGLIQSVGRSFSVAPLARRDVDEIYALRQLLEPAALAEVAKVVTPATLAPLAAALEASIAAHDAGDAPAFIEANAAFRAAWLALVGNRRLVRAVELYADHVQHVRVVTLVDPEVRTLVLRGLREITRALAAADPERAADAMRRHLVGNEMVLRRGVETAAPAHDRAPAPSRGRPVRMASAAPVRRRASGAATKEKP